MRLDATSWRVDAFSIAQSRGDKMRLSHFIAPSQTEVALEGINHYPPRPKCLEVTKGNSLRTGIFAFLYLIHHISQHFLTRHRQPHDAAPPEASYWRRPSQQN